MLLTAKVINFQKTDQQFENSLEHSNSIQINTNSGTFLKSTYIKLGRLDLKAAVYIKLNLNPKIINFVA